MTKPKDWVSAYLPFLDDRGSCLSFGRKILVASFCSGTESPIKALQLIAPNRLQHVVSVECDANCQSFIMDNVEPEHFHEKVADAFLPRAKCLICEDWCSYLALTEFDVLVAGFPCQPFSHLNSKRFDPSYKPFQTKEAQVFFHISRYLNESEHAPKVVILENVGGLLQKSKKAPAPIEFVKNGFLLENGRKVFYGLSYLKRYILLEPMIVESSTFALPMIRTRVFLVLVRKDIAIGAQLATIPATMRAIQRRPR